MGGICVEPVSLYWKCVPKCKFVAEPFTRTLYARRWSRYILNYLYAISSENKKYSITEACSLTTTEYGLLTGYGFSATFVVTGLFMGRAADSNNRRNIIVIGCFIWNAALIGMGSSYMFWQLLMYRLMLGFGQAFSNPASYSMISDLFAADQRPYGNGLFATGCYVGGGLASLSETVITLLIACRAVSLQSYSTTFPFSFFQ